MLKICFMNKAKLQIYYKQSVGAIEMFGDL